MSTNSFGTCGTTKSRCLNKQIGKSRTQERKSNNSKLGGINQASK